MARGNCPPPNRTLQHSRQTPGSHHWAAQNNRSMFRLRRHASASLSSKVFVTLKETPTDNHSSKSRIHQQTTTAANHPNKFAQEALHGFQGQESLSTLLADLADIVHHVGALLILDFLGQRLEAVLPIRVLQGGMAQPHYSTATRYRPHLKLRPPG